jgi:hypothetical protein
VTNDLLSTIIFIICFFIFTLIIYNTTLLKQKEEVGDAFVGGLAGIVIYFMVYLIFGNRLMAVVVGARIWMITPRVYSMPLDGSK